VKNVGQIPPCDKFKLGHQNDGAGHLWCVLANTPHGVIPAKGKQGTAWYAYGGKEHETKDFQFATAHDDCHAVLEKSKHGVPHGTVKGRQNDSGEYHMVVCHTTHGNIPGKSNGKKGWYSYGGKELETHDFSFVVVRKNFRKVKNVGQIPPCNKFKLGHQNDGAGHLWCVLADTPHGVIPAKGKQGKAWYAFGGKEHETTDFHHLETPVKTHLQKSSHGAPHGTVKGRQHDSGEYHMAVCHTPHGDIPGKSNGRKGWYSYGGKELESHDFSFVVVKC